MDKKSLKAYRDADWLRQKYWGEGLSLKHIGLLCGVSQSTVWAWAKMHDIPRRRPWEAQMTGKKYLSKKELESLYEAQRMTMKEIGELCGVCLVTIRNWLIKYGILIRTPSEAHLGSRHTEATKQKMSRAHTGARNPAWRGGRVEDGYGRISIHAPQNPMADGHGYVLEHRLVISEHLGRPLTAEEVVHHINKDVGDNRLENLMLFASNVEHIKFHRKIRKNGSNRRIDEGDNAT